MTNGWSSAFLRPCPFSVLGISWSLLYLYYLHTYINSLTVEPLPPTTAISRTVCRVTQSSPLSGGSSTPHSAPSRIRPATRIWTVSWMITHHLTTCFTTAVRPEWLLMKGTCHPPTEMGLTPPNTAALTQAAISSSQKLKITCRNQKAVLPGFSLFSMYTYLFWFQKLQNLLLTSVWLIEKSG